MAEVEALGAGLGIGGIEVERDSTVGYIQPIATGSAGMGPLKETGAVLIKQGFLLTALCGNRSIMVGMLSIDIVLAGGIVPPYTIDGGLGDASAITLPVVEIGGMGMATETDDIALGKERTELATTSGLLVRLSAMEKPTRTPAVKREKTAV